MAYSGLLVIDFVDLGNQKCQRSPKRKAMNHDVEDEQNTMLKAPVPRSSQEVSIWAEIIERQKGAWSESIREIDSRSAQYPLKRRS